MRNRFQSSEPLNLTARPYEVPELKLIGEAADVILGMPGGGFDGPFGMTEPQFEFEQDEDSE